jgi:hypothetical protein
MIAEISKGHRAAEMFRDLALLLTGRSVSKKPPRSSLLSPLIEKLMR